MQCYVPPPELNFHLHDWQRESPCLAAARLRQADDITTLESPGDRFDLDSGWLGPLHQSNSAAELLQAMAHGLSNWTPTSHTPRDSKVACQRLRQTASLQSCKD